MTPLRNILLSALLLLGLLGTATAIRAEIPTHGGERHEWFQVQIQGQPAGWMHTAMKHRPATADRQECIDSIVEIVVAVRRGPEAIRIRIGYGFSETMDGTPISGWGMQRLGQMEVRRTITFHGEKAEIVVNQAGQEQRQTVAVPAGWMAPAAMERQLDEMIKSGAKVLTQKTLDPNAMQVNESVLTVHGPQDVEVLGRVVPALRATMKSSQLPNVEITVFMDESGQLLRFTMPLLPGMEMEVIQADEALARGQINPPELMAATLIRPEGAIANPRSLRAAVYEIAITPSLNGKAHDIDLPRGGVQRVTWGDENTAIVSVNLDDPVNPVDDLPNDTHRESSAMLNTDDPEVKKLAEQALKELPRNATKAQVAEALRKFVHGYVHAKDLSVGFASASEVARTRQGDCTEHGVLLAALLRVAGIPSRTVSGLVYVDEFLGAQGVFGYHMWTQAWIADDDQGRWVDLDATLSKTDPFDATHIALSREAMSDATTFNDMIKLTGIIGRFKLRVTETSQGAGK